MVVAVDGLYLYSLLSIRWWLTIRKKEYIRLDEGRHFFVHICEYIERKNEWDWYSLLINMKVKAEREMSRSIRDINDRIVCYKRTKRAIDNDTCLACLFRFFSHTLLTRTQNDIDITSFTLDTNTESFTPYTIINKRQYTHIYVHNTYTKLTIINNGWWWGRIFHICMMVSCPWVHVLCLCKIRREK